MQAERGANGRGRLRTTTEHRIFISAHQAYYQIGQTGHKIPKQLNVFIDMSNCQL